MLVEELDSATGLGPHRGFDQVLHLGVTAAASTMVWSQGTRCTAGSG